ncbi:ImmA/IrrE family metallo-endopeptidase [Acidovorax radicis]|uniref:ImmA/IrrE family metallo-endopeptidase n=1 Tax=Acidovorax radicis TaxID=758826 RepID=UPI0002376008|nr:ImmA/IrrE family metallo-endopeptidase [Acidovorax radicis]
MNTKKKGDELEEAIFNLFREAIAAGRFHVPAEYCRIFRQKGYYSRARGSDIIVDVSIEVWYPGADDYTSIYLIECKNYKNSVNVADVESFYAKAIQIGPTGTKPILISNRELQSGALEFCRSMRIGVARYFPAEELQWTLRRSASATFSASDSKSDDEILFALTAPHYRSSLFELYMQAANVRTNSVRAFFEALSVDIAEDQQGAPPSLCVEREQRSVVRYLTPDELENRAQTVLAEASVSTAYVSLNEFCARHPSVKDVRIKHQQPLPPELPRRVLARISFRPNVIELFTPDEPNEGRDRFTLAHELGHFLLDHGEYLVSEQHSESEQQDTGRGLETENDVRRLEYQANYFASCLLMPSQHFRRETHALLAKLEIRDKGFGPLFVDSQPWSRHAYYAVTNQLMKSFGVSRTAVNIRMTGLGLLHDTRAGQR